MLEELEKELFCEGEGTTPTGMCHWRHKPVLGLGFRVWKIWELPGSASGLLVIEE